MPLLELRGESEGAARSVVGMWGRSGDHCRPLLYVYQESQNTQGSSPVRIGGCGHVDIDVDMWTYRVDISHPLNTQA